MPQFALLKAGFSSYPQRVTIATRRRVYWALFGAALLILGAALALIPPILAGSADPAFLRASGALRELRLLGLSLNSQSSAAVAALLSSLYAATILGLVLGSFRKTVSSEIFFFALWALCFGLEAGRLLVFRLGAAGAPAAHIMLAARLVLAGRSASYFAIFASGLYAAGFREEKLGSVAILIVGLGLALASTLPFNTGSYQPSLLLEPGYSRLLGALAATLGLVTVANFIYAAANSGEASYRLVALGAAFILAGQSLLLQAWHPLAILAGSLLLALGSWLFVSRLHAYYLWQ